MLVMATSALSASNADNNDYIDQIVEDKQAHWDAAQALLGVSPGATWMFPLAGGHGETSATDMAGVEFTTTDVSSVDIRPCSAEAADSGTFYMDTTCEMAAENEEESADLVDSSAPQKSLPKWESALLRLRHENIENHRFTIPASPMCEAATGAARKQPKTRTNCPLDALAMLASNAAILDAVNDSDEGEDDVPVRRLRSISNPEGMEKWDSLRRAALTSARHFVQPTIMEDEEGWSTQRDVRGRRQPKKTSVRKRSKSLGSDVEMTDEPEEGAYETEEQMLSIEDVKNLSESDLQEMLRRARAKLLEDAITSDRSNSVDGLVLPHALDKYRELYNKNGRIGIYTPSERAAIIARFNSKRLRRVWNKKIRYSCRKNLADRRLRVKGRFVKRSLDGEEALEMNEELAPPHRNNAVLIDAVPAVTGLSSASNSSVSLSEGEASPRASRSPSPLAKLGNGEGVIYDTLPDLDDDEAGFIPTDDQPYRRTRRHTIT